MTKPKPADPVPQSPDDTPKLGFFAQVVDGPYRGAYGVYHADADPGSFILRRRDDAEDHITVQIRDARPALPGRR